jgi:hypothetical protein
MRLFAQKSARYYPILMRQGGFDFATWCSIRGDHRARFWRRLHWTNLQRATIAHWTINQRHWPESCLVEYMADLSDLTDDPTVIASQRRRRKRK